MQVIIKVLAIFIINAILAQQTRVYHVLPSDRPSTFNQCQVTECYSLTELFSDKALFDNISNTTVILYPGIHIVNSTVSRVISINNATTFTLTAADLKEGATIKCKGKTNFAFNFCIKLAIQAINFESCEGYYRVNHRSLKHEKLPNKSTLLIAYSLDVNISTVSVRNSYGIGLLVVNVCGSFLLSDSKFINNTCNFYFLSKDNVNILTRDTIIFISNSKFDWAFTHSGSRHLHSTGVVLQLVQTKFMISALLSNITLFMNQKYSIAIQLSYPLNMLALNGIESTSRKRKFGMHIDVSSLIDSSYYYETYNTSEVVIKINQAYLRSRLHITNNPSTDCKHCRLEITLSNSLVADIHFNKKEASPIFVTDISRIIMQNFTIKNTTGISTFIHCSNILLLDQFTYQQNNGSVVLLAPSKISMNNTTIIVKKNIAYHYAPLFISWADVDVQNSFIKVENNTGPEGGGIVLANTTITFTGDSQAIFLHNNGQCGGAMAFYEKSKLLFYTGMANFTFIGNHARTRGGAIYVHDTDYVKYNYIQANERYQNFFKNKRQGQSNFYFIDNTAVEAGSAIFGGIITEDFHFFSSSVNDTSVVSSVPLQVCICISSKPNCHIANTSAELQPGQSYKIEIIAVGQRSGTVPSSIGAEFIGPSQGLLTQMEYIQPVGINCTNLTYTVQFSRDVEILQLITTDQTWREKKSFNVKFYRKNCTIGFILNTERSKCICSPTIIDHGMECDIQILRINRLNPKWISSTYIHLNKKIQLPEVIVHDYCPFDYCIAITQSLDLQYPDQQCDFNRSGILCGGCKTNYSHVLGTSKCKKCIKHWMALIIPLIAIAGVLLVAGLILLNLTVSIGTINGLIFYANIIRANNSIFFPHDVSTSFLTTFIAWLNLDLGIEMCFYNGLNAYFKTWFQFLFPLYIWFILSTIIVVSHYSTRISRLVGNNAVQVLATLFLLSYAKLLRIIITVFSSTELVYPDGYHRRVWLYDGNVDYLTGKHIPLFIAALILLIFISFPFTMVLLCTQCMQRLSNTKVLSWVGKLQPLFDAYTGPYKIKHRYWTGLLLLIRVCLFLVFSLNTIGNPMINLLAICITMSCLLAYLSLIGGVYKQWWLNVIEIAFVLNLLILSSGSFYQINTGNSIKPIIYTSAGITFTLFICTLIYHLILKVTKTKIGQTIESKLTDYLRLFTKLKSGSQNELKCNQIRFKPKDEVTYSEVKLEEPLLEGN